MDTKQGQHGEPELRTSTTADRLHEAMYEAANRNWKVDQIRMSSKTLGNLRSTLEPYLFRVTNAVSNAQPQYAGIPIIVEDSIPLEEFVLICYGSTG
jgi:hypothetical protein